MVDDHLVTGIDAELAAAGVPARAERERAYLASDLERYGASGPAVRCFATPLASGRT